MSFTATYDDTLARVRLVVDELPDGAEEVRFERSTDGVRWRTVRGGESVEVQSGTARLDDYEFAGNVANTYRVSVLGTTTVDTFDRTVTDGWGATAGGQAWDTDAVDTTVFDVDGDTATLAVADDDVTYWGVLDLEVVDFDATVTVGFNAPPGADPHVGLVAGRYQDSGAYYFAWVFCQDTVVQLAIGIGNGTADTLDVMQTSIDASETTTFQLRFAATGDELRAKVWPAGESEPADWMLEVTNSEITGAGRIALGALRSAGSEHDSLVASFDDLAVEHADDPLIVSTDTAEITPPLASVWIKNIARPFLNRRVTVTDWSAISRPARGGTFEVVGRTMPVAVTDVRGSRRYELTVTFPDPHAADDFDTVLASGDPVFVHVPSDPDCLVPRSMYAVVGEYEIDRRRPRARRRYVSLPLTEVAAPSPSIVGATVTWQSIVGAFATWDDLIAAEDTWESVAERIGDADEVIVP